MRTRFFFVIYLHDETIGSLLDGMRIIADPMQRNFSHITVKGPYWNSQKKRLSIDNKLIEGKEIKITGTGNFFIENQNTVFLKCEERQELYDIWKTKEEKTYKEFHPHITIYDGKDRTFAQILYETINAHNINFCFTVEKLDLYSTADKIKLFNLKAQVNYSLISKIVGFHISKGNIDTLTETQRITAIDKLCTAIELANCSVKTTLNTNKQHAYDHHLLIEA
jgi:2'-5' RNA ligase